MKIDEAIRVLRNRAEEKTFRSGPTEVPDKTLLRWLLELKRSRQNLKNARINMISLMNAGYNSLAGRD
jgi:hypothetical protein